MSTKTTLKVVIAFGILAMVLIFLGVNYVPRIFAASSSKHQPGEFGHTGPTQLHQ